MSLVIGSHVDFEKYVLSLIFLFMSFGSMSHVDFKKSPCHRVEYRGQGPQGMCSEAYDRGDCAASR